MGENVSESERGEEERDRRGEWFLVEKQSNIGCTRVLGNIPL